MPNTFEEQFKSHLSKFNTYPYLFIGSGLSIRYFNLDNWNNLLKNVCSELKLPQDSNYYFSNSNQDSPTVAEMMAKDFNNIWWEKTNTDFSESREIFGAKTKNSQSPLKYEICKYIEKKAKLTNNTDYLEEIELLKKSNIDGVITTNWDNFIEDNIFKDFNCFIGQEELIFSDSFDLGITYKIHGGIKEPNSLILTKQDYNGFENSYPYLAAKLLTIFVEHPVIFIGYSIQDKDIQSTLKSIIKCLSNENISKLQDRLIFCEWKHKASPSFQDSTMVIDGTPLPIKLIKTDSFKPIFSILSELKRRIPIRVLKNMKDMVYEFVKSSDPKSKVFVSDDLDKIENQNNAEFVYGLGLMNKLSKIGIKGIKVNDLIKDVVFEENRWNCDDICFEWLIDQKGKGVYIPYFKYLKGSGFIGTDKKLLKHNKFDANFTKTINEKSLEYFVLSTPYENKKNIIRSKYKNLDDVFNDVSLTAEKKYHYSILIEVNKIDLNKLSSFLKENYDKEIKGSPNVSHYRKLVCYYDYLKYNYFVKSIS